MLARTTLSAIELGITDIELTSLIRVLDMLERGELNDRHIRMGEVLVFLHRDDKKYIPDYSLSCGTVGCLCGWAHHISDGQAFPEIGTAPALTTTDFERYPKALKSLFRFGFYRSSITDDIESVTEALRNYLTVGNAGWAKILAR